MSYEKQDFVDGQILRARHLNHMEDGIDLLFSEIADLKYTPISILSFSANISTVELGSEIDDLTLSWSLSRSPKTVMINNEPVFPDVTTLELSNLNLVANKTYTLKVEDERETIAQKSVSITFLNGVYYGVGKNVSNYSNEFILGLTKVLSNSRARTITVNSDENEHIYYCIPSRLGQCNFNVGGFDGGFSKVSTIQFTNASGYRESYDIYKSTNANLGNTTVKIT